jgi:hypothetical protein
VQSDALVKRRCSVRPRDEALYTIGNKMTIKRYSVVEIIEGKHKGVIGHVEMFSRGRDNALLATITDKNFTPYIVEVTKLRKLP